MVGLSMFQENVRHNRYPWPVRWANSKKDAKPFILIEKKIAFFNWSSRWDTVCAADWERLRKYLKNLVPSIVPSIKTNCLSGLIPVYDIFTVR